jgi:hypothetical protein
MVFDGVEWITDVGEGLEASKFDRLAGVDLLHLLSLIVNEEADLSLVHAADEDVLLPECTFLD